MKFSELLKNHPELHDLSQLNGVPFTPYGKLVIDDAWFFTIIEEDTCQFVAWATAGPLVATLTLSACEDLVHAYAQWHIVDFSLG